MNYEEEMQHKIHNGETGDSVDELAYQAVFSALRKGPRTEIAPGLADRVVLSLEKRKAVQKSSFDIIMAITGGVLFLMGLIASVVVTGFRPDFGFLKAISDFKGLFLFGVGFVTVLNFIDKQLMRKKRIIRGL